MRIKISELINYYGTISLDHRISGIHTSVMDFDIMGNSFTFRRLAYLPM